MVKTLYDVLKEIEMLTSSHSVKHITTKHTKHFHKNKHMIPSIVLRTIGKKEIVYGEMALKKRFPYYLERPTQDYDVLSMTPEKDAREAERALDKQFGGDFFYVKPGRHPGTWRVMAHANQEGYADFTKPEGRIPFEKIHGKNYVKLGFEKKKRRKILQDPTSSWRHPKDRDAINRINIFQKKQKRRR